MMTEAVRPKATGSYPALMSPARMTELAGRTERQTATERQPERQVGPQSQTG